MRQPAARRRVVPACSVVLQPRLDVVLAAGPGVVAAFGGVGFAGEDVAEGVVGEAVDHAAGAVQDRADRFLEVGQRPADFRRAADVDAAKPVVDAVAPEVSSCQRAAIELGQDVEAFLADDAGLPRVPAIEGIGPILVADVIAIGIDFLANEQTKRIIAVVGVVLKHS